MFAPMVYLTAAAASNGNSSALFGQQNHITPADPSDISLVTFSMSED